jgi:hypothetical protein
LVIAIREQMCVPLLPAGKSFITTLISHHVGHEADCQWKIAGDIQQSLDFALLMIMFCNIRKHLPGCGIRKWC